MSLDQTETCEACSTDRCDEHQPLSAETAALTRRRILRGLAGAAGLAGSLAVPGLTRANHFGCRYPEGTGDIWPQDFRNRPDPRQLDIVTIVRKGYCGYKNGLFSGGRIDLGNPYADPRSGRLHRWDGYWNQNFLGPLGYTNLMIQPQGKKVFRLYGDWLQKYIERGGPGVLGAPSDDAHPAGPGDEQYFLGGAANNAGLFRARGSKQIFVVQGAILDLYFRSGGTSGRFGAPTSHEEDYQGGKLSAFTNGFILYYPVLGAQGFTNDAVLFRTYDAFTAGARQIGMTAAQLTLELKGLGDAFELLDALWKMHTAKEVGEEFVRRDSRANLIDEAYYGYGGKNTRFIQRVDDTVQGYCSEKGCRATRWAELGQEHREHPDFLLEFSARAGGGYGSGYLLPAFGYKWLERW